MYSKAFCLFVSCDNFVCLFVCLFSTLHFLWSQWQRALQGITKHMQSAKSVTHTVESARQAAATPTAAGTKNPSANTSGKGSRSTATTLLNDKRLDNTDIQDGLTQLAAYYVEDAFAG